MNDSTVQIEATDLHKTYTLDRVQIDVLRGVSLSVRRGERLAITGASGAGKSTLLHSLGGLDRPTRGGVRFEGVDLYALSASARTEFRATRVGFVFQAYHLLPELDLQDNVLLPALSRPGALRKIEEMRARAVRLLERVGLTHRLHHRPAEVSGGEQQRAALARAMMNDPAVLLADEPTGNLDSGTGQQVLDYLFALTEESRHTLVLVTHNESVAAKCDRQLHLRDGVLLE
ncbi:MAG: ABC transporter ATP-binding protein [Kiritimatiellae bacterium]|nr:ABC transporter ATP-binding protein [Kiritimatiellia bacterium]MCO5067531.1 ABC transporter ATP-binding protein [Kiritimatiellia bacterium]